MIHHFKTIPQVANFKHVVYHVQDEHEILFISFANFGDVVTLKELKKNKYFDVNKSYDVVIHASFDKRLDAYNHLHKVVKQLVGGKMPKFNKIQHFATTNRVRCVETGQIFKNAYAACKALNIDSGRMTKHLRGDAGYVHIYGNTYERIGDDE